MTYLEIFFQVMQIMHLVIVIWKGVRKVVVIILCLHQTLLITSKSETRVLTFAITRDLKTNLFLSGTNLSTENIVRNYFGDLL